MRERPARRPAHRGQSKKRLSEFSALLRVESALNMGLWLPNDFLMITHEFACRSCQSTSSKAPTVFSLEMSHSGVSWTSRAEQLTLLLWPLPSHALSECSPRLPRPLFFRQLIFSNVIVKYSLYRSIGHTEESTHHRCSLYISSPRT